MITTGFVARMRVHAMVKNHVKQHNNLSKRYREPSIRQLYNWREAWAVLGIDLDIEIGPEDRIISYHIRFNVE